MQNKPKPGVTRLKVILTALATSFVFMNLVETFTSEPTGGFKNSATPAKLENGYLLIALYLIIPIQLALHYYFNFKHPLIVNIIYYISLTGILLVSLFVGLAASL